MPRSDRRLTILGMHYRPELTGNAPYTSGLAEAIARQGVDVTVLCSHPHYPEWKIRDGYGQWRSVEHIADVKVVRGRHWVPRTPSSAARLLAEVSFGLRQCVSRWGRPTAILLVSPAMFSTAVAMLRARWSKARRVIWVQDVYSSGVRELGGAGKLLAVVVRWIEGRTLRSADHVVVIHDSFRRTLVEDLGVPNRNITTIRNWSHVETPASLDSAVVRRHLGWGENEFIALHAGNQGLKQGLENLIEAARIVEDRKLPFRIVLLGDGSQNARLRSLATGLHSIQFLPAVDDEQFIEVLRASDVLVVNEQLGVAEMSVPSKLTSYFAAGRPVVGACAENGGASSELRSSNAGVRVDPGDPASFVDLLIHMRDNPSVRQSLGENGSRYRADKLGANSATEAFMAAMFD